MFCSSSATNVEEPSKKTKEKKNIVIQTIENRHSKRYFLSKPVPIDIVREVLEASRNAASSQNTQPWGVCVFTGKKLSELSTLLLEKFDADQQQTPEYQNRPDPHPEEFTNRIQNFGKSFYEVKGIDRHDKVARRLHDRENYGFFNAPLFILFHLPKTAVAGTFLDMGIFLQNVMLGLLSHGVGSCPQYSITKFNQTIHEFVGDILKDRLIVCGMSCGYPDPSKKVNSYFPEREPLESYVTWFDSNDSK